MSDFSDGQRMTGRGRSRMAQQLLTILLIGLVSLVGWASAGGNFSEEIPQEGNQIFNDTTGSRYTSIDLAGIDLVACNRTGAWNDSRCDSSNTLTVEKESEEDDQFNKTLEYENRFKCRFDFQPSVMQESQGKLYIVYEDKAGSASDAGEDVRYTQLLECKSLNILHQDEEQMELPAGRSHTSAYLLAVSRSYTQAFPDRLDHRCEHMLFRRGEVTKPVQKCQIDVRTFFGGTFMKKCKTFGGKTAAVAFREERGGNSVQVRHSGGSTPYMVNITCQPDLSLRMHEHMYRYMSNNDQWNISLAPNCSQTLDVDYEGVCTLSLFHLCQELKFVGQVKYKYFEGEVEQCGGSPLDDPGLPSLFAEHLKYAVNDDIVEALWWACASLVTLILVSALAKIGMVVKAEGASQRAAHEIANAMCCCFAKGASCGICCCGLCPATSILDRQPTYYSLAMTDESESDEDDIFDRSSHHGIQGNKLQSNKLSSAKLSSANLGGSKTIDGDKPKPGESHPQNRQKQNPDTSGKQAVVTRQPASNGGARKKTTAYASPAGGLKPPPGAARPTGRQAGGSRSNTRLKSTPVPAARGGAQQASTGRGRVKQPKGFTRVDLSDSDPAEIFADDSK